MSSSLFKLLIVVLIVSLGALVLVDYSKRAEVAKLLKQQVNVQQMQGGNTQQNLEIAKEMATKVRKLIDIPTDIEPTVAQIVNVNALRATSSFYARAKNGDYLLVTKDRAILYSPEMNRIIDVVPVQLQPQGPAGSQSSEISSVRTGKVTTSVESSLAPVASSDTSVSVSSEPDLGERR